MQRGLLCSVGLMLLLLGCTDDTHLVLVELQTDFVAGVEFDQVAVLSPLGREVSAAGDASYVQARRVAELELPTSSRTGVEVTLLRAGQPIAQRTALFTVEGPRSLTLLISRDCRGVVCGEGTTCVGGECRDSTCVTGEEDACVGECSVDTDCPELDLCATRQCEAGSCLYAASDTACSALDVCIPESGCEPRAPVADAGPPDAGPDPCEGVVCEANQACRDGVCGPAFDCIAALGDPDGDGIPESRDPWPGRCNTLIDFQVANALSGPWAAPGGAVASDTGLTLTPDMGMTRTINEGRFYIETTFVLGAIENVDDWKVNVRIDSGNGEIIICHPFRVAQVDMDFPGEGPRLRLAWEPPDPIPVEEGLFMFPEHPADFSAGQRYTLQLWQDASGHLTCQLADDAGRVGERTSSLDRFLPNVTDMAGMLTVGVSNRSATFERILIAEP